jgi:hypothetical protein
MLGRVTNGAACDPVKQIGTATTEWHLLAEKDVSLASPTYKGRQLIAVCVKQ